MMPSSGQRPAVVTNLIRSAQVDLLKLIPDIVAQHPSGSEFIDDLLNFVLLPEWVRGSQLCRFVPDLGLVPEDSSILIHSGVVN